MDFALFAELPFKEPVIVFTILIVIILVAPIVFKKFRIPGIVGLIVAGMLVGPHGINLIESGNSISLLSNAGLLYLMFLAGLELNARELKRSLNKSLVFGALTFFIPLILGFFVAHYILSFSILASLLIASMFSTHTLIAYPIASRLGIARSEAVTLSIGGTIITDTAVLVLLAFISAATTGSFSIWFWVKMLLSLSAFSFAVLWGVPRLSSWIFKNLEVESGTQYVYVLSVLFVSGLLARLAGIEPIIGAFLAGLAMSNLIPPTSALMNRISFIGNNLFIPIFLIGVGMLVDFSVFFKGSQALIFAGVLVVVALFSKYIAAWITQIIFGYSKTEKLVIFGMSVSHAAAIIAVVIVGYNLKLIGLEILNGAIMIIVISCFIGTIVTERYGRKLAVTESEKSLPGLLQPDRILVPVANPATIESLVDFGIMIRKDDKRQPIYMLTVVPDDENASEQIAKNNKMYESAISHAAAADTLLTLVSRVDINVANGISRAIKELMINKVVLGWNGKITTTNFFFGSIIENLIGSNSQMMMVVKASHSLNTTNRLFVVVPPNSEYETGFKAWYDTVMLIASRTSASVLFYSNEAASEALRQLQLPASAATPVDYKIHQSTHPLTEYASLVTEHDLLIVVAARRRTLSYCHYLEQMPRDLARNYEQHNFIIIYPGQHIPAAPALSVALDGLDAPSYPSTKDRFDDISATRRKTADTRHNSVTE